MEGGDPLGRIFHIDYPLDVRRGEYWGLGVYLLQDSPPGKI